MANGTVNFTGGETRTSIPITIIGDQNVELNETLNVTLLNPVNAELNANPTAVLTITDDDGVAAAIDKWILNKI